MFGQPQFAGQHGWGGDVRPHAVNPPPLDQRFAANDEGDDEDEMDPQDNDEGKEDNAEEEEDTDENESTTLKKQSKTSKSSGGRNTPHPMGGYEQGGTFGGGTIMDLIKQEAGKYDTTRVDKELELVISEDEANKFRALLIESPDPVCILYMKQGSAKPQLLHSVTKCDAKDTEYFGEYIGFTIGNRGDNPILLPKQKTWKWTTAKVPDVEILTDAEDEDDPWTFIQNAILLDTEDVPFITVCPLSFVKDLVLSGKTVYEGYNWLEETFPDRKELKGLKRWFAAASYRDQLKLTMKQVETMELPFHEWVARVLTEKNVGGTVLKQNAPNQQQQGSGTVDPQSMMLMAMIQQQQASNQQLMFQMQCQQQQLLLQQQGGAPATTTKAKKSDPSFEALMCGFACVRSVADLPSFLDDTEGLDDNALDRYIKGIFTNQLNERAKKKNHNINISWDLQSDNVSDWREGKFSIGRKGMYEAGSQGMSPFNAVELTEKQINARREKKAARKKSAHTLTYDDALIMDKEKWEPLNPPTNLSDLTKVLMVYENMLAVVHGEKCDMCIKTGQLVDVLQLPRVVRSKEEYEGIQSLKIFWAVVVESREYFDEVMTPDQLSDANPPFPESTLDEIFQDVKRAREVRYPHFPPQWLQLPKSQGAHPSSASSIIQTPSPHGGLPHPVPQQQVPTNLPFNPWFLQQMYQFPQQQLGAGNPPAPAPVPSFQMGAQMPMAPQVILAQINRARASFPDVTHRHIIRAAGKEMNDLPKLDGKVVCFLGLLGLCQYHSAGGCHFMHVTNVSQITPQFIKEWEAILTKGVDQILADGKLPSVKRKGKKRKLQEKN